MSTPSFTFIFMAGKGQHMPVHQSQHFEHTQKYIFGSSLSHKQRTSEHFDHHGARNALRTLTFYSNNIDYNSSGISYHHYFNV